MHRYLAALAALARHHVDSCLDGTRQAYRSIRSELGKDLHPYEVDEVLAMYRVEGARQAASARAVPLLEAALRGEVFRPKV